LTHYFENNENLESKLRIISYIYKGWAFNFYSDIGVFSKNKIDYGSQFLLETFLKFNDSNNLSILDVGCGYGFIGICLAKILNSNVDMIDINKRAIHLTKMNVKVSNVNVKVFISNSFENVKEKYNIIITNPPIRAGKKVVLDILLGANDFLEKNGELWCVIRKDQGAKSIKKELENIYNCRIIAKSKGFYIIKCNKVLT